MSKTAAVTASHCRLHSGGFGAVLAILVLLPPATLAANPEPTLRRSDHVDVRRLGKVSEDERSVLRIEWRAGLAGVEETRSVQDMLDKLRRLETGVNDVSQLVRNMPAQAPAVAAAVPAVAVAPVAAATSDTDGYNVRLMVANLVALALVALWWFRRRKPAAQPETGPESAPEDAPPGVALRTRTAPVMAPPVIKTTTLPEAEAPSGVAAIAPREVKAPPDFAVAATPDAAAEAAGSPGDESGHNEPGTAPAPAPAPIETTGPVTEAVPSAPETKPPESFAANDTMIFDFSLEEADPDVVARENAKLQAVRPASPPVPPPTAPVAQKTDVEPTLQLAEIMLSMGLEQGAAQALIEYTEANPRHAIYHWLKLLGIYRSRGLQKEFAATAEKLRLYFNIQAAEWGTPVASEAPTLENFSRVSEHVQKIWKQPEECMTYLRHLLEDNRDGVRAGFPQSVAEEILLLVEILKEEQV